MNCHTPKLYSYHLGTHWAEVDDARNIVCRWRRGHPSFPLDQLHIAIWERAKLFKGKFIPAEAAAKSPADAKRSVLENKVGVVIDKKQSTVSLNVDSLTKDLNSKDLNTSNSCLSRKFGSFNGLLKDNVSNPSNTAPLRELDSVKTRSLLEQTCSHTSASKTKNAGLTNQISKSKDRSPITKRKNAFEPYIPKKKRLLSNNCLDSNMGITASNSEDTSLRSNDKITSASTAHLQSKEGVSVDNTVKQNNVCGIDSGYSSPSSNSSCNSLPLSQSAKDDNINLLDIIHTLECIDFPNRNMHNLNSIELKSSQDVVGDLKNDSISCTDETIMPKDFGSFDNIPTTDRDHLLNGSMPRDVFNAGRKLESPLDFPDIETVSNCGTDFMDDIDFVENMEFLNTSCGQSKKIGPDILSTSTSSVFAVIDEFTNLVNTPELQPSALQTVTQEFAQTELDSAKCLPSNNISMSSLPCSKQLNIESESVNGCDMTSKSISGSNSSSSIALETSSEFPDTFYPIPCLHGEKGQQRVSNPSLTSTDFQEAVLSTPGQCNTSCDFGDAFAPIRSDIKDSTFKSTETIVSIDSAINLPELTDFLKTEMSKSTLLEASFDCAELLEEMFPNSLLKESTS